MTWSEAYAGPTCGNKTPILKNTQESFAYSCFGEFFLLALGVFLLTAGAFLLTIRALLLTV